MLRLLSITSGFLSGLLIGMIGHAATYIGSNGWTSDRHLWSWELFAQWAMLSFFAAMNGAVGAWNGFRSTARRPWPVIWIPIVTLICPLTIFSKHYYSPQKLVPVVLVVVVHASAAWVAGRVGQEIGSRFRNSSLLTDPIP